MWRLTVDTPDPERRIVAHIRDLRSQTGEGTGART
jgi:hypothetical protein